MNTGSVADNTGGVVITFDIEAGITAYVAMNTGIVSGIPGSVLINIGVVAVLRADVTGNGDSVSGIITCVTDSTDVRQNNSAVHPGSSQHCKLFCVKHHFFEFNPELRFTFRLT